MTTHFYLLQSFFTPIYWLSLIQAHISELLKFISIFDKPSLL